MKNIGIKEQLESLNKKYHNKDNFLSKDILTIANQINASRNLMFNLHLEQYVVLHNPDVPKVFTGYENEVGKYSTSYYRNDINKTIVAKISKYMDNDNYYILVTRDKDGVYDVIERKIGEELTENYAYLYNNDKLDRLAVEDTIEKGEILYHSTSFDENMNFRYGANANVCYMIEDNTIEDAIICSKSFAKRMKSHYITEVNVTLNNNDLLCNLYGDGDEYKSFPDVGESNPGRVLVARRRINYDNALFDLQNSNLRKINYGKDDIYYCNGKIVDIQIRSNRSDLTLAKSKYNKQVVKYLHIERDYNKRIIDTLKPIIDSEDAVHTNELSYIYRKACEFIEIYEEVQKEDKNVNTIRWESDKSEFDNFIITFKILSEDYLKVGSKICNRFGSKGVISKIEEDHLMPTTADGKRADIILNALGVINRLNTGQMIEHELNFVAENIIAKAKTMNKPSDQIKYILDFYKFINKEEYVKLAQYFNRQDVRGKKKLLNDMLENGLYIHQPPFWNNVGFDEMMAIYDKYDWIEPYQCYIDGKPIEKKLIIAPMYILKLKHQPLGKFSVRDTYYLNNKNVPGKIKNYKEKRSLYSNTPIRIGEMELNNLQMTLRMDSVKSMISMYASSETNRHKIVERLLLEKNPTQIQKIDTVEENHNREILDAYLKCLSMELVDGDELPPLDDEE